ncbi:MAG: DUF2634 domain-containing protein [Syntrophomonadaceae bacterium]|nr:DUF2634 domain-containing protein [Syntrophomonadaceae bacterium]
MANLLPTDTVSGLTIDKEASTPITFGKGWKFDFDAGEFVTTPTGRTATADENEAFMEWCQKALLTPRYRHLIYGRQYGHDFDDLIGRGFSREVIESEIQRIVKETLTVDPRTDEVKNLVFVWEDSRLYFTCDVISIKGDQIQVGTGVVI